MAINIQSKTKPTDMVIDLPSSEIAISLNNDDDKSYVWAGFPNQIKEDSLVEVFYNDQLIDNFENYPIWKTCFGKSYYDEITILKIDKDVNMKTVYEIKDFLKDPQIEAYKVLYSTKN